jgi:phosphoserine phosphatase
LRSPARIEAAAEARRRAAEPDIVEPAEHAKLVLKWLQDHDHFGHVLSANIKCYYPRICEEANVVEISTNKVFKELKKLLGEPSRLEEKAEETGQIRRRRAYWVPKPKAAKVVAIDRRQMA